MAKKTSRKKAKKRTTKKRKPKTTRKKPTTAKLLSGDDLSCMKAKKQRQRTPI